MGGPEPELDAASTWEPTVGLALDSVSATSPSMKLAQAEAPAFGLSGEPALDSASAWELSVDHELARSYGENSA